MKTCRILLVTILALSGCATFVEGERATPTSEGLRYSLPAPFLMVTPKPDGTLEVVTLNLPDPDNTYTLRTKSVVSTYTLDVLLENQMLKSVGMNGKSDAVSAAAIDSLGNVRKAQLAAADKARDDAKTQDAADDKALADADLAVALAQRKLDLLKAAGAAADKILDAEIALGTAQVTRDALRRAQRRASGARLASADAPASNRAGSEALVPGPMLFRIVPDGSGVKLVAARGPTVFSTSVAALPAKTISPAGPLTFVADANGVRTVEVTYSRSLKRADNVTLATENNPGTPIAALKPTVTVVPDAVSAKITITLAKSIQPGRYALSMDLIMADDSPEPQLFEVVVLK